jgi:hypothetical protein
MKVITSNLRDGRATHLINSAFNSNKNATVASGSGEAGVTTPFSVGPPCEAASSVPLTRGRDGPAPGVEVEGDVVRSLRSFGVFNLGETDAEASRLTLTEKVTVVVSFLSCVSTPSAFDDASTAVTDASCGWEGDFGAAVPLAGLPSSPSPEPSPPLFPLSSSSLWASVNGVSPSADSTGPSSLSPRCVVFAPLPMTGDSSVGNGLGEREAGWDRPFCEGSFSGGEGWASEGGATVISVVAGGLGENCFVSASFCSCQCSLSSVGRSTVSIEPGQDRRTGSDVPGPMKVHDGAGVGERAGIAKSSGASGMLHLKREAVGEYLGLGFVSIYRGNASEMSGEAGSGSGDDAPGHVSECGSRTRGA